MKLALFVLTSAFAAAQPHHTDVAWTWSQGSGDPATGFNIYRTIQGEVPALPALASVAPTAFSYTDVSAAGNVLVQGTTYCYSVTTMSANGESTFSPMGCTYVPYLCKAFKLSSGWWRWKPCKKKG